MIISKFKRFKIIWKIPGILPAEDCGQNLELREGLLSKTAPEGVTGASLAIRLEMDGQD